LVISSLRSIGQPQELIKIGLGLVILYAAVCFNVWQTYIIVSDNAITLKRALRSPQSVAFKDITRSIPQTLAEPAHPVALLIFRSQKRDPIVVRLKPYRREDVAWLLSLSRLRVSTS